MDWNAFYLKDYWLWKISLHQSRQFLIPFCYQPILEMYVFIKVNLEILLVSEFLKLL